MKKEFSEEIADKIIQYLEDNEYKYGYDEEKGIIKSGFSTSGKIGSLNYVFDIREEHYVVYVFIDLHADEKIRKEVAEYLTRANYGIRFGNFELDMNDGEIRYKVAVDCDHINLSREIVETSVNAPFAMFNRYGEHLCRVIFGLETAKEAITQADETEE